jgi:hypothetical protein
VMRGSFSLEVYIVDAEGEKFDKKDTVNLKREILANGNPGFDFKWLKDVVHDIQFHDEEDKSVRVCFTSEGKYMEAII